MTPRKQYRFFYEGKHCDRDFYIIYFERNHWEEYLDVIIEDDKKNRAVVYSNYNEEGVKVINPLETRKFARCQILLDNKHDDACIDLLFANYRLIHLLMKRFKVQVEEKLKTKTI